MAFELIEAFGVRDAVAIEGILLVVIELFDYENILTKCEYIAMLVDLF